MHARRKNYREHIRAHELAQDRGSPYLCPWICREPKDRGPGFECPGLYRLVGCLPERFHRKPEKEVPHDRISDYHDLVDIPASHRAVIDRMLDHLPQYVVKVSPVFREACT